MGPRAQFEKRLYRRAHPPERDRRRNRQMSFEGWQRSDGRKGIRNVVAVAYLVECAHHVSRRIVDKADDPDVQLIGFPGCYPNAYAAKVMQAIATHPNVGGMVIVSLGCESFDREGLRKTVAASGRP